MRRLTDLLTQRHRASEALQTATEDHDEAAWKRAAEEVERLRLEWERRQRWAP